MRYVLNLFVVLLCAGCVTTPDPIVEKECNTFKDWVSKTRELNPQLEIKTREIDGGEAETNLLSHFNARPPESYYTIDDTVVRVTYSPGSGSAVISIEHGGCLLSLQHMPLELIKALLSSPNNDSGQDI